MKGKQLAFVLVLLVALGGVALFLGQRNSASWSNTATKVDSKILDFPLNDVLHVTIKENSTELNLARKDGVWTVAERTDYPADFDKVGTLIRKLWELRAVQEVKIGPSQLGRLELAEPDQGSNTSGILIDLKGAGDKRIAALLVGKKYLKNSDQPTADGGGFPAGRYVMGEDGSNRAFLVSDTFDEVQTKPEQWLNREFVKIENPKLIAVAGAAAEPNWKITRDAAVAPWRLAETKPGAELDNSKASAVASMFSAPSFADVLAPDAATAETGLDKPSTVRIETFDNFVYDLRIGKLMGDNYPVLISVKADLPKERTPGADEKPEDKAKLDEEFQTKQKRLTEKLAKEQRLPAQPYLIMKSTIDQVLKDRASLMAEKKSSPSPTPGKAPVGPKASSLLKSPVAAPRTTAPVTSSSPSPAKPPK